jgi:hypothetical protein
MTTDTFQGDGNPMMEISKIEKMAKALEYWTIILDLVASILTQWDSRRSILDGKVKAEPQGFDDSGYEVIIW